eukprot:scaffold165554_cov44-Tisochrysis_lutea.AAC.1
MDATTSSDEETGCVEVDALTHHEGPQLAAHERARKMKQKPPPVGARSTQRTNGRKTPEPSKNIILQRLKDYPNECLQLGADGALFCLPCVQALSTPYPLSLLTFPPMSIVPSTSRRYPIWASAKRR